jgi:hypothetical protein
MVFSHQRLLQPGSDAAVVRVLGDATPQMEGDLMSSQQRLAMQHVALFAAHSCLTAAIMNVLIDAFPSERDSLQGIIHDEGLSRISGGLHYPFDVEAGRTLGARAARLAFAGTLER